MVYRYLRKLCGSADLAEELTQETFYQAIKSVNRYDGTCSMSTWLCQIGKHMWLRELRRRKRFADEEITDEIMAKEKSPEELYIQKEQLLYTMKAIQELSEQEREVVVLRAAGSLSFREIGESMGRSESWARVTFFRAKQKLKEKER